MNLYILSETISNIGNISSFQRNAKYIGIKNSSSSKMIKMSILKKDILYLQFVCFEIQPTQWMFYLRALEGGLYAQYLWSQTISVLKFRGAQATYTMGLVLCSVATPHIKNRISKSPAEKTQTDLNYFFNNFSSCTKSIIGWNKKLFVTAILHCGYIFTFAIL